jgi:hypothetical protein
MILLDYLRCFDILTVVLGLVADLGPTYSAWGTPRQFLYGMAVQTTISVVQNDNRKNHKEI